MMATAEKIEKMRQGIMRFRELLNIMRQKLDAGERAYEQLFSSFSPVTRKSLAEKELQGLAAHDVVDDPSYLLKTLLTLRFDGREMERSFEELYNILIDTD